jgi:sulfoxide reductase heme-binding subunit YedZ
MLNAVRWAVTVGGALPGLWLWLQWQGGGLGVVPDEVLLHMTGRFALFSLVATLALGPLHALTGWIAVHGARRPLGLWAFGYALAHLSVWLVFDQGGYLEFALEELANMAHLQLGLAVILLMLPLAITSTDGARTRLTPRWWKRLHLLVWPAAALAVIHAWMVARFGNPLVVGLGVLVLVMAASRIRAALRTRTAK